MPRPHVEADAIDGMDDPLGSVEVSTEIADGKDGAQRLDGALRLGVVGATRLVLGVAVLRDWDRP
jgi:hypothetical protein